MEHTVDENANSAASRLRRPRVLTPRDRRQEYKDRYTLALSMPIRWKKSSKTGLPFETNETTIRNNCEEVKN